VTPRFVYVLLTENVMQQQPFFKELQFTLDYKNALRSWLAYAQIAHCISMFTNLKGYLLDTTFVNNPNRNLVLTY